MSKIFKKTYVVQVQFLLAKYNFLFCSKAQSLFRCLPFIIRFAPGEPKHKFPSSPSLSTLISHHLPLSTSDVVIIRILRKVYSSFYSPISSLLLHDAFMDVLLCRHLNMTTVTTVCTFKKLHFFANLHRQEEL